jgi:exonuclease III
MEEKQEIKVIFWNIGKDLNIGDDKTFKKLGLIAEAIDIVSPDIFCIAEGTPSKDACQKIVDVFLRKGYSCYYSPLFSDREDLKPPTNYNYDRYGLKIFIKDISTIKTPFAFTEVREVGRIVALKIFFNYQEIIFIFLHNKSKEGETHETLDQADNIKAIYEMISLGKQSEEKERIIIMGDFNLNPWDRLLEHKTHLNTSYLQNRNSILQRNSDLCFYNPIVELLSKSGTPNLGGTYYSNNSGWGLLDFVLYDTRDIQIQFDIITEFNGGSKLLNSATNINKSFFNHSLDHLPIISTVTKLIS